MIQKVYFILKQLNIPVKYIVRPELNINGVAISYHFFNYKHNYYGDGKGNSFSGSLQIDIFYKRNLGNLEKEIIELLENYNFKFFDSNEYIDDISGIRLYRKVLVFNFWESEVK